MAVVPSLAFGTLLRRYRKATGLTQEELAEQAGLSARSISDLERGLKYRPHRDTVQLLADALQLEGQDRSTFEEAGRLVGSASRAEPIPPLEIRPPLTEAEPATQVRIFLIADLRGYTAFTHERGDEAAAVLAARFAAITREVVTAGGGELVELRGDEALAGFVSARGALRAAVDLQRQLDIETERDPTLPLRAGIGLDAGEAIPVERGFRGGALNLAARLCTLAGPREVFASEGVIHLARTMGDLVYLDRGEVEVKGVPEPVRLIQVVSEGDVPQDVPRFSVREPRTSALPIQPTPFIGREREREEVSVLLGRKDIRLLTLTGPGGTGKTRLALQAANEVLPSFRDGVFFVSLAPIADPDLVASTIAATLEVKEVAGQPLEETLKHYLRDKQMLVVLDNFEHVLDAASLGGALLASCPKLKFLITSRAVLHLSAEHVYVVPPLAVPDLTCLPALEALFRYDAVALFTERANAATGSSTVTHENAPAVAEICSRLDGLPLAINLAAARVRVFPPRALLQRLERRLELLTGGARDDPARLQTLRGTIDWSHSLLSQEEQALFARLSVFVGGCTFEAAEAVCNPEGELDLLKVMTSLVEQSVVQQEGEEEPRFRMLETIREYAAERVVEREEADEIRNAHAMHYLELAQEADPELRGPSQREWFERLEAELDNLRSALGWRLERGEIEEELRLATALRRFWAMRGYWSEGLRWLEAGLALGAGVAGAIRARALHAASDLLRNRGEYERAIRLLEEALSLSRELGDKEMIAGVLRTLGTALHGKGDQTQASRCYEESLGYFRELGDRRGMGDALVSLGDIAGNRGNFAVAEARIREGLALEREVGDTGRVALCLNQLGWIRLEQGKYEEASALVEESLALTREVGRKDLLPSVLDSLACVAMQQGDLRRAAELFGEGLTMGREIGGSWVVMAILGHAAELAVTQGKASRAARLGGAEAAWRDVTGGPTGPRDQERRKWVLHQARRELGEDVFRRAWEAGRAMSLEEAVAYALGENV